MTQQTHGWSLMKQIQNMAKQKETRRAAQPPARRSAPAAPALAEADLVEFVAPEQSSNTPDAELPEGWDADNAEEAPSSLTPAADWQRPGQYFIGEYIGMQNEVGPNKSRLYAFRGPDDQALSIWGSTALDARMDFLTPAKGDTLLIQFLGEVKTSRGLNPVKTFRVMRRR